MKMINAWKKLVHRGDTTNDDSGNAYTNNNQSNFISNSKRNGFGNGTSIGHGIEKLDKSLQRKFAKGVQYNMRIVIKGDSRVGKSCLFNRLKGGEFIENYTPTEEMRVTSIQWNYKATDDVVKIDVWECVNNSSNKKHLPSPDLKLHDFNPIQYQTDTNSNIDSQSKIIENDKSTILKEQNDMEIDVYRGCDAVILMMDMTKLWTFKYVQKELETIPRELPVLIVSNHRDLGHHRVVTGEQVKIFISSLDRYPHEGPIMYVESSMRNGFGLKFIHKFINIPFLRLQEKQLVRQLEMNRCEMCSTKEELAILQESDDYEKFLELATIRRRQQADLLSPVPGALASSNSAAAASGQSVPIAVETNGQTQPTYKLTRPPPSIIIGAKCSLPNQNSQMITIGTISGPPSSQKNAPAKTSKSIETSSTSQEMSNSNDVKNVIIETGKNIRNENDKNENFILDNNNENREEKDSDENEDNESDSDDGEKSGANPLVANYQDDLDPDDICDGIETGTARASSNKLQSDLNQNENLSSNSSPSPDLRQES